MTEIHLVVGTRPEAIKIAPLVLAARAAGRVTPVIVATGQHPTMVAEALAAFGLEVDVALTLDRRTGTQPELVTQILTGLDAHLAARPPAAVVVHGDTSTTLAGALAAFWRRIPVVHLEAGLRSGDLDSPFPEEANRRLVGQISRLNLAPTPASAANLHRECVPGEVVLTGNTVVDAALAVIAREHPAGELDLDGDHRLVLVTAHRRESWGAPLDRILGAVATLHDRHPDVRFVFPSHPNPQVRAQVDAALAHLPRVTVTDPLPYQELTRLLSRCHLVLSDSGGIQEEAPTFGVPVLVLRDVTERAEAIEAGCARLVGTDPAVILAAAEELLTDPEAHRRMGAVVNPFGDGHAGRRSEEAIVAMLRENRAAGAGDELPALATLLPTMRTALADSGH
ncbi:UDP-N-acetylglucosamine 2-epimerase (non-hydrolyzing) [Longispora sp. K20-0274]|uniref:non-hydrolyzing UDP-N-acetylglucosamine 2-epimerase n=1 Tax=Longispora sp. K20-0274 TaxID=3088255 RepID=UPI00399B5DDB